MVRTYAGGCSEYSMESLNREQADHDTIIAKKENFSSQRSSTR